MTIGRAAVEAALDEVVDPCSAAMGTPLGLHEMGLAHRIDVDAAAGSVVVTMRLTSPCCAYGPTMAVAATERLARVAGVHEARVEIDHGAVWTPDEMTPVASAHLAVRRRTTRRITGVEPYDWTNRNDPEGAST